MEGIIATSYSAGDKFYIDPAKLLPLARFLPQPKYVFFALLHASFLWLFLYATCSKLLINNDDGLCSRTTCKRKVCEIKMVSNLMIPFS